MFHPEWSGLRRLMFMKAATGESLVEATATGNPATFTATAAKPLVGLTIPFTPIQSGSGDPSPTNVRPITGWTGANIYKPDGINQWDERWEAGAIDPSTGAETESTTQIRSKGFIPVISGRSYYLHIGTYANVRVIFFNADKTYKSNIAANMNFAFTVPSNAYYMRFYTGSGYGNTYQNNISINYPATDTGYHAFSKTYPVTFPASAGTIYGGTIDPLAGTLTVTHALMNLNDSSLSWAYGSGDGTIWRANSAGKLKIKKILDNETANACCNKLTVRSYSNISHNTNNDYSISIASTSNEYGQPRLRINSITEENRDALMAFLADVQFIAELATPLTFALDPVTITTIVGDNTLWTDTNGTNTVTYLTKS